MYTSTEAFPPIRMKYLVRRSAKILPLGKLQSPLDEFRRTIPHQRRPCHKESADSQQAYACQRSINSHLTPSELKCRPPIQRSAEHCHDVPDTEADENHPCLNGAQLLVAARPCGPIRVGGGNAWCAVFNHVQENGNAYHGCCYEQQDQSDAAAAGTTYPSLSAHIVVNLLVHPISPSWFPGRKCLPLLRFDICVVRRISGRFGVDVIESVSLLRDIRSFGLSELFNNHGIGRENVLVGTIRGQ